MSSPDAYKEAAEIMFRLEWDVIWAQEVAMALGLPTSHSRWTWEGLSLSIAPKGVWSDGSVLERLRGQWSDVSVLGLLDDIQCFARRLMDREIIEKVGRAKRNTLHECGDRPPKYHYPFRKVFADCARRQLSVEFS